MSAQSIEDFEGPRDGIARTPEHQQSAIPQGWKPTPSEPLPVVQCTVIKKDGTRCKRWSIRGATVCATPAHGGRLPHVREKAEALIESARMRIIGNADVAVDVLEDLMAPGTSENVRLKAATEVLDRAGVRGGYEVEQKTEIQVSPGAELTDRLKMLRRRSEEAKERLAEVFDGPIIEGELVDEDPEAVSEVDQPSLFDL